MRSALLLVMMVLVPVLQNPVFAAENAGQVKFENLHKFSEKLAGVSVKGRWGFIDDDGKTVVEPLFHEVRPFHKGYAPVKLVNKWGIVDRKGRYVINPTYDDMGVFSEDLVAVKVDGKWGYINVKDKMVIQPQFSEALQFSSGLAAVRIGSNWGFIDSDGRFAINPRFAGAGTFAEDQAPVQVGAVWGFIDKKGNQTIKPQFQNALNFSDGRAAVQEDTLWGFVNSDGTFETNPQYDSVLTYSEGLAAVQKDGKWGYINRKGKIVIPLQYTEADAFSNDIARVASGDKVMYISPSGKDAGVGVSAKVAAATAAQTPQVLPLPVVMPAAKIPVVPVEATPASRPKAMAMNAPMVTTTVAPLAGGVAEIVIDFLGEMTKKVVENSLVLGITAYNDTKGDATTSLMLLLLEGTTGVALDSISENVIETKEMVEEIQDKLNMFQSNIQDTLKVIQKDLNTADFNEQVQRISDMYFTVKDWSDDYNSIITAYYTADGKLKKNMAAEETDAMKNAIDNLMYKIRPDPKTDQIADMLKQLRIVTQKGINTRTIYDTVTDGSKLSQPFEHQTYNDVFNFFNQVASIRATAVNFHREYWSYQWNLQTDEYKKGRTLESWLNEKYLPLYNTMVDDINTEAAATTILNKMASLLVNVDVASLPQNQASGKENESPVITYFNQAINQKYYFFDDKNNKTKDQLDVYQVISNVDGKQYLIVKKPGVLSVTDGYDGLNYDYKIQLLRQTPNGRFQLANNTPDINALFQNAGSDPLSYLKSPSCNLLGINDSDGIVLGDTTTKKKWVTIPETNAYTIDYQILNLLNSSKYVTTDYPVKYLTIVDGKDHHQVDTRDIWDGVTYKFSTDANKKLNKAKFLSIYYDTHIAGNFLIEQSAGYNKYAPQTAEAITQTIFSLDDGDVLDLSALKGSLDRTVRISGNATIIGGGPDKVISNLKIETYGGNLTVQNLYLKSDSEIIKNIYDGFKLLALGANSFESSSSNGVFTSSSGNNVTITVSNSTVRATTPVTGSLMLTNSSSGPAVKTTGTFVAQDVNSLTVSTQGKTSISSDKDIQIINSTVKSSVAKESNSEFNSKTAGKLENSTLDMTYGASSTFQAINCTWKGKIRYKADITTYNCPDCGTDDKIDITITGKNGVSVTAKNIGQIDGDQFKPGAINTFYFSGKELDAIDTVSFKSGGTDGWFPGSILFNTTSGLNNQSMRLNKWVDNNKVTTFNYNDMCGTVNLYPAAVGDADLYFSVVYDGGKQTNEVRLAENLTSEGKFRNLLRVDFPANFGAVGALKNVEGIVLRADKTGSTWYWLVSEISAGIYSGTGTLNVQMSPQLWIKDTAKKLLGITKENTGEFEVTVKTADKDKAGTDSDIYLKVIGSNGETDFQDIKHLTENKNNQMEYDGFEKGMTDTFRMAFSKGIGVPQKLVIKIKPSGDKPGWVCEFVEIAAVVNGQPTTKYHFAVNTTFDTDGKEVEFPLTSAP